MKPQRNLYRVLAAGFIVLFFWNVCLYWCNYAYNQTQISFINLTTIISPLPKELIAKTPDHYKDGYLWCSFNSKSFFRKGQTGIIRSFQNLIFPMALKDRISEFEILHQKDKSGYIEFAYDRTSRQILLREVDLKEHGNERSQKIIGYLGPKGFSITENPVIGRFEKPIFMPSFKENTGNSISHFYYCLYDAPSRRFYRIEMNARQTQINQSRSPQLFYAIMMDSIKVIEGPLQNQLNWAPVQISDQLFRNPMNGTNPGNVSILWKPPYRVVRQFHESVADEYVGIDPNTMADSGNTYQENIPLENAPKMDSLRKAFFVLHQDGRVDYLNGQTFSITQSAGYLPAVGFYEHNLSHRPQDMADYEVRAFYDPNGIYAGTVAAAVSRDGTMAAIDFYNAEGKLTCHRTNQIALFSRGWDDCKSGYHYLCYSWNGPFLLTVRYLLENLQPPVLRLLDIPAAKWITPDNRYNTLFVQPNSFIGLMKFEYDRFGFWKELLLLMLPSLILSLWLAFKARQKAVSLGYAALSSDGWFITVLAFGIPAYITFCLLMPKERMVTCANCGNLRRVEFEVCQSCKRDWKKTQLLTTAPNWQVRDGIETTIENPPMNAVS